MFRWPWWSSEKKREGAAVIVRHPFPNRRANAQCASKRTRVGAQRLVTLALWWSRVVSFDPKARAARRRGEDRRHRRRGARRARHSLERRSGLGAGERRAWRYEARARAELRELESARASVNVRRAACESARASVRVRRAACERARESVSARAAYELRERQARARRGSLSDRARVIFRGQPGPPLAHVRALAPALFWCAFF